MNIRQIVLNTWGRCMAKVGILIVLLLIYLYILESHYVAMGECVARIYYYPLGRWDYILIPFVGIIMLSISLYFIHTSLKMRVLEMLVYSSIIITTLIWGNDILASRTEDWPDTYKVQPATNKNQSISKQSS